MAPALLSATICFQTGFLVQWKTASIYKMRVVWLFVGKLKWLSVNELTDCFSKAYKSVFQKSSSASVAARSNGEMRGGVAFRPDSGRCSQRKLFIVCHSVSTSPLSMRFRKKFRDGSWLQNKSRSISPLSAPSISHMLSNNCRNHCPSPRNVWNRNSISSMSYLHLPLHSTLDCKNCRRRGCHTLTRKVFYKMSLLQLWYCIYMTLPLPHLSHCWDDGNNGQL